MEEMHWSILDRGSPKEFAVTEIFASGFPEFNKCRGEIKW